MEMEIMLVFSSGFLFQSIYCAYLFACSSEHSTTPPYRSFWNLCCQCNNQTVCAGHPNKLLLLSLLCKHSKFCCFDQCENSSVHCLKINAYSMSSIHVLFTTFPSALHSVNFHHFWRGKVSILNEIKRSINCTWLVCFWSCSAWQIIFWSSCTCTCTCKSSFSFWAFFRAWWVFSTDITLFF